MTKARQNMQRILEKTGMYRFEDGVLAGEMSAYEVGFKLVEDAVENLLADLFIETASGSVLLEKEKIFRAIPSSAGKDTRRKMLLARFGDTGNNGTLVRFQQLLAGAGVQGVLKENRAENKLIIESAKVMGITAEQAQKELEQLLPAHLVVEMQT